MMAVRSLTYQFVYTDQNGIEGAQQLHASPASAYPSLQRLHLFTKAEQIFIEFNLNNLKRFKQFEIGLVE